MMPRPRGRLLACPRRRPACALVLSAASISPGPALPAVPAVRTLAATLALPPVRRSAVYRSSHIFSPWDHRETFRCRQPQWHFRKSCRTGPRRARQRHGRAVRTARQLRWPSPEPAVPVQGASRIALIENVPGESTLLCDRGGPPERQCSSLTELRGYPSRERWTQYSCRRSDRPVGRCPATACGVLLAARDCISRSWRIFASSIRESGSRSEERRVGKECRS